MVREIGNKRRLIERIVNLAIYLFEARYLVDRLHEIVPSGRFDLVWDVLIPAVAERRVAPFLFEGYWEDLGTLDSYYAANRSLLPASSAYLMEHHWPIYTLSEERPPARFGSAPAADNSTSDTSASAQAAKNHSDDTYVIGANDVLAINVWKEAEVSRSVPVRSDGKISLPLVGELQAAGQTPRQLEQEITKRLQSYISEPEVTVIVTDSKSQKINILGMVARPGAYLLSGSTTVLDSIAMAGGFKDFAKKKSVYVLRTNPDGTQKRIPFNYNEVIKGTKPEQNVKLMAGDTVVVP